MIFYSNNFTFNDIYSGIVSDIKEGKIQFSENKKRFSINKKYVVDSSMMIEAEQMQGLKNYLKEFTLIKEKEPIEVNLWNEYLIYAQIFGMAKEVAKQFKKLYSILKEKDILVGLSIKPGTEITKLEQYLFKFN